MKRNKVISLDASTNTERFISLHELSPEQCLVLMEEYQNYATPLMLCRMLRDAVLKHTLFAGTVGQDIAAEEAVTCRAVAGVYPARPESHAKIFLISLFRVFAFAVSDP